MKIIIGDLWKAIYGWIEQKVATPFDGFANRHAKFLCGLLVLSIFGHYYFSKDEVYDFYERHLSGEISYENLEAQNNQAAVGGLGSGLYADWYVSNDKAVSFKDGYVVLNSGYGAVRFEYSEKISFLRNDISFLPQGKIGMDVELARTGLYQIVIGDNSYEHVGFKYMKTNGEWGEYERRRFENCVFHPDDVVSVNVNENYIQKENEYTVELTFMCEKQDGTKARDMQRYSFTPVPNMKELTEIYIGLIDSSDARNQTKVYFVNPDISSNIANY